MSALLLIYVSLLLWVNRFLVKVKRFMERWISSLQWKGEEVMERYDYDRNKLHYPVPVLFFIIVISNIIIIIIPSVNVF